MHTEVEKCSTDGASWIFYRACDPTDRCINGSCEPVMISCGNRVCDAAEGETCQRCPEDCGECCGNGTCEPVFNESASNCPGDCGKASDARQQLTDGGAAADSRTVGALRILSLTATATTLTGGEPSPTETASVTFVAIVTDTKGLDNIAGGQLLDDAGVTYGSFGTGSTKGTYSASVTWTQVNQGRPIDFPTGIPGARKFVAKFFDNDGNIATAPLTISLQCRPDPTTLLGACGGVCTDTNVTGDHCGACATACSKGRVCGHGQCTAAVLQDSLFTQCASILAVSAGTTCTDVCAQTSTPSCNGAYPNSSAQCDPAKDGPGACATPLAASGPYVFFQCGCK